MAAPEVVLAEIVRRREAPGEEAAAERAVGDEADPELADGVEHLALGIPSPERPFRLQRRDRMDGVRAADRPSAGLGEAEMLHLSGLDQLGHRADRLLDRRFRVDAVLVVKVDVIDAEPPQRGIDCLVDVLGRAVDRAAAVLEPTVAELRGDDVLVAPSGNRLADELLVRSLAVDVCGVEEVDPELERAVDRRDRLLLVGRPVPGGHPHAAEALCRHLQPLAERAPLHIATLATMRPPWPSPRRKPPSRA